MKQRHLMPIAAAVIIAALYALMWGYFDIASLLSLEMIQCKQEWLLTLVREHYMYVVAAFVGLFSIHGALAMPATSLLMITGGFLFGVVPGIVYSLIASIVGGTSCYYITRLLFGNALNRKYHQQLAVFREQLEERYTFYLIMIRVIPVIPFFLANVLAGLALIPYSVFLWTLIVGIFPSLCIYSFLGTELGALSSVYDLLTPKMLSIYVVIALLTILPIFYRRWRTA